MGFKPRSYLKVYHNIKHSTFVYPDEKRVQGSSQAMDAIIHSMIEKDKIAIVRVQVRENASVRFCALLPSLPKNNNNDDAQPGFYLIVLPFADDMRDLDAIMAAGGFPATVDKKEKPVIDTLTKDEKYSAKVLIKNMTMKDFKSREFENPTIQKFYAWLQALALGEDEPEPVQDLLEPNKEDMKIFKPLIDNFRKTFALES